MKRILIVLIASFTITATVSAQSKVNAREVQQATNAVAALYQLDETQKEKVYEIQDRRLRNLAQIETIKATDYDTYVIKRRAIQIGTDNAIKRLLNETQLKIYEAQIAVRRQKEVDKMIELKKQGASKEEIEKALLEIE
ncbi:MAG: hypothetical protein IPJ74_13315 [Saprospiraceae bacterium]|nr:hypothetical protein [Saprospiraceae bacterium]